MITISYKDLALIVIFAMIALFVLSLVQRMRRDRHANRREQLRTAIANSEELFEASPARIKRGLVFLKLASPTFSGTFILNPKRNELVYLGTDGTQHRKTLGRAFKQRELKPSDLESFFMQLNIIEEDPTTAEDLLEHSSGAKPTQTRRRRQIRKGSKSDVRSNRAPETQAPSEPSYPGDQHTAPNGFHHMVVPEEPSNDEPQPVDQNNVSAFMSGFAVPNGPEIVVAEIVSDPNDETVPMGTEPVHGQSPWDNSQRQAPQRTN